MRTPPSRLLLSLAVCVGAILACQGSTQSCEQGEEFRNGACLPAAGSGDTDSDTDTDTDSDSDSDTDTDTDTDADTDTGSGVQTVADVQLRGVLGAVELPAVIVTTPIAADGSFFVQDAGGGEWSGVRVYPDAVSFDVAIGDEVTIRGFAQEYYDETEVLVDDPAGVDVTGTGRVAVTSLSAPPADWEPYEGVLVEAVGIALGEPVDDYGQWSTDWGILVDDYFVDYSPFIQSGPLTSLTGVMRWSYDEEKLCPRRAADFEE